MISVPRSWSAWFIAACCLLLQFAIQIQPAAMIPSLEADFSLDAEALAILTSGYFISYLICQMPIGWLLDRHGPRLVLTISMALTFLGMVWFGLSESFASATSARVFLGICGAPAFAAAALVAVRWFPARRFALMLGLTESFTLVGGLLVALLLPALDDRFGRIGSSSVFCLAAVILGILCWVMIRDRPELSISPSDKSHSRVWSRASDSVGATLRQPRLWLAALHGGFFFTIVGAFGGLWGGPFLRARLDVSFEEANRLLSVLFLAGAIGAPILGLIATRVRWRGPTLIIASFGCALFSSMLILARLPEGAVVFLLFGLGFFAGGFALDLAFVRELVTERMQGFALGTANLVLGIIAGPLMLMLIAGTLEGAGMEGTVTASNASYEQIRSALVWFVGGLALAVPIGVLLVWMMRPVESDA
jgi:MFS family permease